MAKRATRYRYQLRVRCLNPLIHKPSEWVTYSWHRKREDADRALEWQKVHGGCDGVHLEARIFEVA